GVSSEGARRDPVKQVPAAELRAAIADVLAGGPERDQRRRAQTGALSELARIQRGGDAALPRSERAGPRLSRLEHARPRDDHPVVDGAVHIGGDLTEKQRSLLRTLAAAPSVSAAAGDLGVSRSNVYASLR